MKHCLYGSETMLWKVKERSRVRGLQVDNLRGLVDIRRMDRVPNVGISELCRRTMVVDERIKESVLRWFGLWRE